VRAALGEVYRATGMHLKRDVAVKVLPPSFVDDADRLARFQREAEVLASLNHRHSLTLARCPSVANDQFVQPPPDH